MVAHNIIPYSPEYEIVVRDIIGTALVDIDVIPKTDLPLDDDDLRQIPEFYGDRGGFWIAICNGSPVGTVALKDLHTNTVKLKRLFVLPEFHGTGIGTSLLAYAIQEAKKRGFTNMVLHTDMKMKRAHRFYEKNGFVRTETHGNAYHYALDLTNS